MDESAESDEDEGRASMRAWRFVPEPEMRTTRRRGSVDDVGSSVSEDMMTDKNEMVVNLMWREHQEGRLILKIIYFNLGSYQGQRHPEVTTECGAEKVVHGVRSFIRSFVRSYIYRLLLLLH